MYLFEFLSCYSYPCFHDRNIPVTHNDVENETQVTNVKDH